MARRFRFRLETVLKLRRQREDGQKRVVAGKVRELAALQSRARVIGVQVVEAVDAARGLRRTGPMDMAQIARQRFWLSNLQRALVETGSQMRETEGALASERQVLAALARDREALEKLREKHAGRYQAQIDRAERVELDELAIAGACRKARS